MSKVEIPAIVSVGTLIGFFHDKKLPNSAGIKLSESGHGMEQRNRCGQIGLSGVEVDVRSQSSVITVPATLANTCTYGVSNFF